MKRRATHFDTTVYIVPGIVHNFGVAQARTKQATTKFVPLGGSANVTCINEQARLLLNDNPVDLCALQDKPCCPFPKRQNHSSRICPPSCTVVTLMVPKAHEAQEKKGE
jgi:hypothetical protein